MRDSSRICGPNKTAACRINDPRDTAVLGEKKEKWQQDNHSEKNTQHRKVEPKLRFSEEQSKTRA